MEYNCECGATSYEDPPDCPDCGKTMKRDRLEVLEREHADFFERWHAERMKREKLERALIEARRWIGDGDCSDGLSREYWTHAFADVVALVDAALKTPNAKTVGPDAALSRQVPHE